MKQDLRELRLRQVEERLATWRGLPLAVPPRGGWIRMIREALGMTTPQLARRLGLTRQSVAALEQREAAGTITLEALRRAAESMDCEVVYAVVPRVELGQMIRNRAVQRAEDQLARVGHSMRLEAQGVSAAEHDRQVREAADALLRGSRRDLWND